MDFTDDPRLLRATIRDLVAISVLPAAWAASSPSQVAESLIAALRRALFLDICYIRLTDRTQGRVVEFASTLDGLDQGENFKLIANLLGPWLNPNAQGLPASVAHPLRTGRLYVAATHFGLNGEQGGLVATSSREGFPSETDRLLLRIGLNQAAMSIQHKWHEDALRESDRQKDHFLAVLAHELRNPLAVIYSAAAMNEAQVSLESDRACSWEIVFRQAQHMKRMLEDLLDISRITQGRITLHQERLDITHIIEQAIQMAGPLIHERRHHLTINHAPKRLQVYGDLTRLAQILANLLNNAASYTPEGGHITLTIEATNEQVVLKVADNGLGIPQDAIPSLFEPFNKASTHRDYGQGGLGLGLAVVHKLVLLHGGTVEAHSEGPGRGSEFVVRLPCLTTHPTSVISSSPPEANHDDKSLLRVLLVEDNLHLARFTSRILNKVGYAVQTAKDGETALEIARTLCPDVVILDIGLAGMSGLEVAQQLRQREETSDARIIAVSGYGQPQDIQRSREAGCDDHLIKPVTPQDLIEAILKAKPAAPGRGVPGQPGGYQIG